MLNIVLLLSVSLVLTSIISSAYGAIESGDESNKLHIVYMGSLRKGASYSPTSHHLNLLQQVIDGSDIENHLVRSYKRSFNGFAAVLNDQQREKLSNMRGVVSVFPSREYHLQTTRSWDFLGLPQSIKRSQTAESDLVIGVIDSGIWPESESFNDKGLGSISKKWRGVCAGGVNFTCNNKVIGARFYGIGDDSARDANGHGTHTSSTAGGSEVKGVSFYGLAKGTARGGAPSSRIAAYKTCNNLGMCSDDAILSAFDDAIADGVDVITVSMGKPQAYEFVDDAFAIGSFHAMENGILTVQAAGNDGPNPSTVKSIAPWVFSVAATTIDRQFIDKLILGNGKTVIGSSINIVPSNGTKFPIAVHNAQACPAGANASPEKCDCIDKNMVKGKFVLCGVSGREGLAYANGAIGSINNVTETEFDIPSITQRPSLNLEPKDFVHVQSYTNSTKYPVAELLKTEIFHDTNAPKIIYFSSRGPNPMVPEIMKPDISAPGVNILAAYPPMGTPKYNLLSGTSMSCPHVAGVVAYVRSFHPDWSPAAIKSAIMTTAEPVKGTYDDLVGEFAYGSGNVNPQQAVHPGLVYDISKEDYVQMLCNYGYDAKKIKQISGDNLSCHVTSKRSLVKDINYPSMVIPVRSYHKRFNVNIHRTVTNVGFFNSTYKATLIHHDPKIKISVKPKLLTFRSLHEKKSFAVTVIGGAKLNQTMFSSSLIWSDGIHNVKSPIIVQLLPLYS
ncbi:subtilisin-like protease SBT4.8 [Medicago truncatula]|uniref:Subtilisin-like serine endopeptidase family protein n=1 Tax=Medicago truncatula TaxID=3880 RepID=G7LAM9_MEDTR|nr:subtilisin-like protease SBT4.8 [Medicago truncatula]AET01121.1 subtilisin-like serine endopeptidase family protein [Medicago truncatula]AET01145.1 subtilisin-like serine endopeptidase family protein [Medicago truncatula]KEH17816.1 subtilisin-like serine endopeptidase family protein [Medicago truncatula]